MGQKRRRFQRSLGGRAYKKLFVLAVEGVKTEPQYFGIFNNQHSVIRVTCLKGGHGSSPLHVLKRMKEYLRQEELRMSDQAWLVVDKDQWTDEQLSQLHDWAKSQENFGFALSNPMFEYWLLLHFEDGNDIASSRYCTERLTRYLTDYDKGIDVRKFTNEHISAAIRRAKDRDQPPCSDWPRNIGCTTIYRLVEELL